MQKFKTFYARHHRLVLAAVACAVLLLIAIAWSYYAIGRYNQYVYRDTKALQKLNGNSRPVGIVLGGGIKHGQPLPLLQDRLDAAGRLLQSNQLRKVVVSGDNRIKKYSEPDVMKNYLINKWQIAPGRIQTDYGGRSTYETCERANVIFDLHQAVLISESTHLPRAIYLCRSFGIEAVGYASNGMSAAGLQVGQRSREVIARFKAVLNVYTIGEETVLGKKIKL